MTQKKFDELRRDCPWRYVGMNDNLNMCRVVQRKKLEVTCKNEYGLECNMENCAVLYWLAKFEQ